jgi:predicted cation transporter
MIYIGLFIILAFVLFAPFSVKRIEEELEIFLFVMGCFAVTVTSQWSSGLVKESLVEPLKISLAVFVAGFIFRELQKPIARNVNKLADLIGLKFFAFLVIAGLGFISSIITAIIAALVLVEIISCLTLDRKDEIFFVVLACFAIGFGAVLTPMGEPLSTITLAKLRDEPYQAGFFFLMKHLWRFVIPGIVAFGFVGFIFMPSKRQSKHGLTEGRRDNIKDILIRAVKVYFFVMALVLLGQGFKPIIDAYVLKIPNQGLYWLNLISAVLDNATLAAAEISPWMGLLQIKSALLGLLIAGGMLIPGNIPNIISAGKLKIKSSEWARVGVPLGFVVMVIYSVLLLGAK